jgi:5-hmdU DNA kinase, helical domain
MNVIAKNTLYKTPVYDFYWRFAAERQSIYYKRLVQPHYPWTDDPILGKYKFTNAYRILDRVSQYLVSNIIIPDTSKGMSKKDKLFRVLLFKIFNKIETWDLLEESLGGISWSDFSYERYEGVLSEAFQKRTIYSAAYIMASGCSTFGCRRKHQNHLKLLELMMNDGITDKVTSSSSMKQLYDSLLSYPLIGPFLAYQYSIDINYSDLVDFSENDFVVAGPGARDGIEKCFYDKGRFSNEEIIRIMVDSQESEFERLKLDFKGLFGRSLKLIDCQNIFCEIGKYARVSHPNIKDNSGRTKIKQLYRFNGSLPEPAFPLNWGLSSKLNRFIERKSM